MIVTKCPKCGKEVSELASKCRYCRTPFPRNLPHRSKLKEVIPVILIVISTIMLGATLLDYSPLSPRSAPLSEPVTETRRETAPEPRPVIGTAPEKDPVRTHELQQAEITPDLPINKELCNAVKDNDLVLVRRLLMQGAMPDAMNENGVWTPLMYAVESDNMKMVDLLFEHGAHANVVAPNSPDTPLMYASNIPMIELLVKRGANIHLQNRLSGLSVLTAAIYNQSTELLEYYLNAGVDINIRDRKGMTPLMLAAKLCRLNLVKLLIKRGASINARDKLSQTALDHAKLKASDENRDQSCRDTYVFLRDQGHTQ